MHTTINVLGGMFDSTSVVETVNGYPRGNKAVDASFFARMMQCFYTNGVVRPGEGFLAVTPGEGMRLKVSPGCGWIDGHMGWVTEEKSAYVEAGHSYQVILRLRRTEGAFTLQFLEDVEGITRNDTTYDLLLAQVSIPAEAVEVTQAMIQDKRLDPAVCGAVNSPVTALDAVSYAETAGAVGGIAGEDLVSKSGAQMNGALVAHNDATGAAVVRNIRYGNTLPETLNNGEIFILLAEEA